MTGRCALTRQSGSKVIVMVDRAPGWASGSSNVEAPAQNPADLASFMTWLATHYRGQVEAYEIWNEQNTTRFWPAGVNAGQYAAQLKAAYPAVKTGDPAAKVLFGGHVVQRLGVRRGRLSRPSPTWASTST